MTYTAPPPKKEKNICNSGIFSRNFEENFKFMLGKFKRQLRKSISNTLDFVSSPHLVPNFSSASPFWARVVSGKKNERNNAKKKKERNEGWKIKPLGRQV